MKRHEAIFDGKDLVDDSLRDEVFQGCYWAADMKGRKSHMVGPVRVDTDEIYFDGIVDAQWNEASNTIRIELVACPCPEDFYTMRDDFFKYYEREFKDWERGLRENCFGNDSAEVEFQREGNVLFVSFWWLIDE